MGHTYMHIPVMQARIATIRLQSNYFVIVLKDGDVSQQSSKH